MICLPPLTITPAMLTSTTVVEVAPAAYAGGTTYVAYVPGTPYTASNTASVAGSGGLITIYKSLQAGNTGNTPASSPTWWASIGTTYQAYVAGTYGLGDRVIDASVHLVYESQAASNTAALSDTTKWKVVDVTQPWAMFDTLRNTATSVPGSITVALTPGQRVDGLALDGLVNVNSLSIVETSGGTTVFDTGTVSLNTREVFNSYDYCFKPFSTRGSYARFDLPPYTNGVITVTLTATSGNVSCGALVLGLQVYMGALQFEAESDTLNFSTVSRNLDGTTGQLTQRRSVPKTINAIYVDKSRVNAMRALRTLLAATPAIWSGLDDKNTHEYFEAIFILGFYKRFTINLKQPTMAVLSLELEQV